jgi:predicted membrane protein (TIGR00267 family)
MLLGITAGFGLVADPNLKILLGTMLTSSIALGVSSGYSSFEAETLEREKIIGELEESLLTTLKNTDIEESNRNIAVLISLVNFVTPLFVCGISIFPYLFTLLNIISIQWAAWISIASGLISILVAGSYFSTMYINSDNKRRAVIKGARMAFLAGITFLLGRWIETLI